MSGAFATPMDYSLPHSSVHEVFQGRILECVAIPFSGESAWCRDWTHISSIAGRFFTTGATWETLKRYATFILLIPYTPSSDSADHSIFLCFSIFSRLFPLNPLPTPPCPFPSAHWNLTHSWAPNQCTPPCHGDISLLFHWVLPSSWKRLLNSYFSLSMT